MHISRMSSNSIWYLSSSNPSYSYYFLLFSSAKALHWCMPFHLDCCLMYKKSNVLRFWLNFNRQHQGLHEHKGRIKMKTRKEDVNYEHECHLNICDIRWHCGVPNWKYQCTIFDAVMLISMELIQKIERPLHQSKTNVPPQISEPQCVLGCQIQDAPTVYEEGIMFESIMLIPK